MPSSIYDEVDVGISGRIAEIVGSKLKALGAHKQILCITHLPQVAVQGSRSLAGQQAKRQRHPDPCPRSQRRSTTGGDLPHVGRHRNYARNTGARSRHAETGWKLSVKVQRATVADAAGIHDLLQRYPKLGRLLPRLTEEIVERLDNFLVGEQNSALTGCISLEVFTPELGKVPSLAVDPVFALSGHGRVLVEQLGVETRSLGLAASDGVDLYPGFLRQAWFQ